MSKEFRRYEILLPLRFNDESPVPDELIAETILEVRDRFGAVSTEMQVIRGHWQQRGKTYRDELMRFFVDVADTEQNLRYFRRFKSRLKKRFRQAEIWLTSHPVDLI